MKSGPLKLIILTVMMFKTPEAAKRNISLIMIILLTVVFCGSIDLTCDPFSSGGRIKGGSGISVSRSLIAFPSASVNESNNGSNGNDQNFKEEITTYNIFCRIAKKLLALYGCDPAQGLLTLLKHYYISICIAGCTCLFLLAQVRFIHLKDGSK